MERTVKLKYSDLDFAKLNSVIGFNQSTFQKKNTARYNHAKIVFAWL